MDIRVCNCGCAGRHTINAIWRVIVWSYSALRIGRHPTLGPDFEELKGIWKDLAGKPLRIRGTVGHAGADWEAFSDLFGTRRWNHGRCPCQWCSTSLQDMHDLTKQHGPLSREIMDAEKEATCVTVQLTRDLAQGLQTQLEYDTRKDGSRGRALLTAVGPTLRTGDRLEWIQGCQDLRIDITALPENITVKLFRPAPTSRLTSWCALYFCDDYGGGQLVEPGQLVGGHPPHRGRWLCPVLRGSNIQLDHRACRMCVGSEGIYEQSGAQIARSWTNLAPNASVGFECRLEGVYGHELHHYSQPHWCRQGMHRCEGDRESRIICVCCVVVGQDSA